MRPQESLFFSLATIGALLLMLLVPDQTEPTTAGWVGYGIVLGLLLGVALRAASILLYERSYKRTRKTYRYRSR